MNDAPSRWFAETETQVQFYDLDPMEVVWHGHYVNYLEIVRGVLLDTIDHGGGLVLQLDGSAPIVLLVDLGHLPPMPELAQAAVL